MRLGQVNDEATGAARQMNQCRIQWAVRRPGQRCPWPNCSNRLRRVALRGQARHVTGWAHPASASHHRNGLLLFEFFESRAEDVMPAPRSSAAGYLDGEVMSEEFDRVFEWVIQKDEARLSFPCTAVVRLRREQKNAIGFRTQALLGHALYDRRTDLTSIMRRSAYDSMRSSFYRWSLMSIKEAEESCLNQCSQNHCTGGRG